MINRTRDERGSKLPCGDSNINDAHAEEWLLGRAQGLLPHGGNGRKPEETIGKVLMAVRHEQVPEPSVQLLERMGFGQNNSGVSPVGLRPAFGESLKVLAIECDHDALASGGKGQVVFIGEAEIAGVPGGRAIHALFGEHPSQHHRHVFVEVEPHWTVVSHLFRGPA